ncbi:MAG: hypothetical protein AAGK33_11015 [Pseudomonadota bacterium]
MAFFKSTPFNAASFPGPQDAARMVWKTLKRRAHRARKRREVACLLSKQPFILDDMGITHGDVHEALTFRGDPSLHLRALAARRRFNAKRTR